MTPRTTMTGFDRVRVRKALGVLHPLGITAERLAEVAGHMAEARMALEAAAEAAAARIIGDRGLAVTVDTAALWPRSRRKCSGGCWSR